jgi:uncharacterized protein
MVGVNKNHNWEINYGSGKKLNEETINDAGKPLKIQWMIKGSYIQLPVWN